MAFLTVENISGYNEGRLIVDNVSFEQQPGENIAIAGETGSGKTSLLKMIAGLMQPSSGNIFLKNSRVAGPDEQLIAGHKKIAFLSQHFELRNNYRVEELLDMANKISAQEAVNIYEICDIGHLLKRWSDELSGGEKQRISLARLLTGSPDILLLDEPFSNLDMLHKQQMKAVIEAVQNETGVSCILVSHDALDILSWAQTVYFMKNGSFIQKGTAEELYFKPINEYAAALLGTYNLLDNSIFNNGQVPIEKGKKIFIRPQQLQLLPANAGLINGVVHKILFWGSYFSIDVLVGNQILSVYLASHALQIGETVGIDINLKNAWML